MIKTGNTEKMAYAITDRVKKVCSVIVKRVNDVKLSDLVKADGMAIGSPTYYGLMSGKV